MQKMRWGVLGVANIAVEKVIPPIMANADCAVTAIASRSPDKASAAAAALGIEKPYGSYEALLADPDVDAVYIPLPNNLHVDWSVRAAEAGKHVLCEKPLGMNAAEIDRLIEARDRTGRAIQEAFMVWTHPQWVAARDMVRRGRIGELRAVNTVFSYNNTDAENIRNIPETGGGGVYDIGCYAIIAARYFSGQEPLRVVSRLEFDPKFGTDRLASVLMDFEGFQSSFLCSTQLVPYQRVHLLGTAGRIEMTVPFNALVDAPNILLFDDGSDVTGGAIETIEIPTCDQYGVMASAFAQAVFAGEPPPLSLEASKANMAVIDAVFRSARTNAWEQP